jgi:hypothetical protein
MMNSLRKIEYRLDPARQVRDVLGVEPACIGRLIDSQKHSLLVAKYQSPASPQATGANLPCANDTSI